MFNLTRYAFVFTLALFVTMLPDMASAAASVATAADFGDIGAKMCSVANALRTDIAKGIATLAIIFLGIGAFFGKVNWGLAVTVIVGVGAMMGAPAIVSIFAGTGTDC